MDQNIRVDRQAGVAVVVLDRPPVNAVSWSMYAQIRRTFHDLAEDPSLRAVVLTGEGRIFCAGNDVKHFADDATDYDTMTEQLAGVRLAFYSIYDLPIPVIAAVNGAAIGTGLALASLCDIRLGSTDAVLALPEIDVGVLGGGRFLARLAGQGLTRWMVYTGKRVDAHEALAAGLLDRVTAPETLMSDALALAREIAGKSSHAVRLAKLGLNRVESMNMKEGYEFECTLTASLRRSLDAREAAASFLEHRAPQFGD